MENPKNNMAAVQPDSKNVGDGILTPHISIPFSFKSDSNNFLLSGTRVQTKAFMRHLIERFGEDARLGDVLNGSKITERKLENIEERRNI
jgi:hypothetical protein